MNDWKLNPIVPQFGPKEHATWGKLFEGQRDQARECIHPIFMDGLEALKITGERIPELAEVNTLLKHRTGFEGVYVSGFEDPLSFFPMLAQRTFPIGAFIREPEDLSYTPAPDVFHDLYGHLPFLANLDYANFNQKFGEVASRHLGNPKVLRQFDRFYWFAVEFPLIRTENGIRIFGAGIASSFGETRYALSSAPEVRPFNLELIRKHEFRIDEYQEILYLLNSTEELYESLESFESIAVNASE